jgi:hypothetical protein
MFMAEPHFGRKHAYYAGGACIRFESTDSGSRFQQHPKRHANKKEPGRTPMQIPSSLSLFWRSRCQAQAG